jgi:cytochrome c-type biogenesis protein
MTPARYATAFLFGVAVALAYRPCVTPSLTEIYRIASSPARVNEGAVLLTAYSLGIATVITAVGIGVSWAFTKAKSHRMEGAAKKLCGAFLLVIAVLVLTGNMTTYKSFLVGRFVPESPAEDPMAKDK